MAKIDDIAAKVAASGILSKAELAAKRKAEKEARRQEKSAAVEADNWSDRDGKARPTPERRRHGVWELKDGDRAGDTVAVDRAGSTLDALREAKSISHEECEAGWDFAALMARTRLVSQGRSCLDFTPVGYDGDFEDDTAKADSALRAKIFAKCNGPWVWAELRRVCCEGKPVSHLPSLQAGLQVCIKAFSR